MVNRQYSKTYHFYLLQVLFVYCFFYLRFNTSAQTNKVSAADALYEQKQYNKAADAYTAILKESASYELKSKLANCYRLTKNYVLAEKQYAEVANSTERKPMDVYYYAECLKYNGNITEAKKWYEDYTKLEPNDRNGLSKLNSCSIYLDSVNSSKCVDLTIQTTSPSNFTSPDGGKMYSIINFNASPSAFEGETITEHYWDFDDNSIQTGSIVTHKFLENRSYTIKHITTTEKTNGSASIHCGYKTIDIRANYKPGNGLLDVQKQNAETREKTISNKQQ